MHAAMQLRVEGLTALRARTCLATVDLYAMLGKEPPAAAVRFQVVVKGKAFHVVELATGKTQGFRFSHPEAVSFAKQLERIKVRGAGLQA